MPRTNLSLSLSLNLSLNPTPTPTQTQWKTYSAGVDVTVDGDRLDAHLATGLDHLIQREKTKHMNGDDGVVTSPSPLMLHEHSGCE